MESSPPGEASFTTEARRTRRFFAAARRRPTSTKAESLEGKARAGCGSPARVLISLYWAFIPCGDHGERGMLSAANRISLHELPHPPHPARQARPPDRPVGARRRGLGLGHGGAH